MQIKTTSHLSEWLLSKTQEDFPGGAVVKKPANAGDMGSSPGLGRSHMPWSNNAHGPQLLSLHSRAHKPQLLKPACLEPVLCNERGLCTAMKSSHCSPQLEKVCAQQRRHNTPPPQKKTRNKCWQR